MNTHRITTLELNTNRLATDLARTRLFRYGDAYSEYICGAWRTCMLWNKSGDIDDNFLKDSEQPARVTAYGKQLPYLAELLAQTFHLHHLRFARLAKLTPGSVLMPHRDFLELQHDLTRVHIPLVTDSHCFSAEETVIYQMKRGEVWFMDATKIHTAAAFSRNDRLHLILDFTEVDRIDTVLRQVKQGPQAIPQENVVPRKPLDPGTKGAFLALAGIIDAGNYKDIMGLLIKKYFTTEMTAETVFDWLSDIAGLSGNQEVMTKVEMYREKCLIQR